MLNARRLFTLVLSSISLVFLQGCLENAGNSVVSASSFSTDSSESGLSVVDEVISLTVASATTPGALLAADFVDFQNKEDSLANPTSNGMILSSTAAGVRSWINPNSLIDASTAVRLTDDFVSAAPAAATSFGEMGWQATVSGAGAACAALAVGNQIGNPGQISCSSGTTATGRSTLSTALSSFALGGGEIQLTFFVRVPILSVAGQTFVAYFGFADNTGAGNAVDGVYFTHDSVTGNWFINTADNSTRTSLDSGVAVVADTWTKLQIVVNEDGTEASFFIDGTEAGNSPVLTNLPSLGRDFGMLMKIEKGVGVTARTVVVDYVQMVQTLTTPR